MVATEKTTPVAAGKGTAKAAKAKPTQADKQKAAVIAKLAKHQEAREKDPTIPVDVDLVMAAKAIQSDYEPTDAENDAIAQKQMGSTPQAPAASKTASPKGKATAKAKPAKQVERVYPAFVDAKGVTVVATRAAYHAVDGTPEGNLRFLGIYPLPTHTEAIEKARKDHKLGAEDVIVTLNARSVVRSVPPAMAAEMDAAAKAKAEVAAAA